MWGRGSNGRGGTRLLASVSLPAAVLALGLLSGCGGGSGSSTGSAAVVPSSPAASTKGSSAQVDAVASIGSTPIAKASYEHWLAVEQALGATDNPSHQALAFLISSDWVIAEAAGRHLSVSDAEVKQRLAQNVHQGFPKAGALKGFLAKSHQTEADLLARVKVELLEAKIAAKVTAGKRGSQRSALLASFEKAFHSHWKAYTTCKARYLMEDCAEYKGKPENLTASSTASRSGAGSAGSSRGGSSASGQASTAPGTFSISSPALEGSGVLPAQYTCDGSNISPPLQWSNVPARAAALVLFMIDDTTNGPAGGIRWIVGDISPTATGVAAGQTPAGGILGANGSGHTGYGGICPPRGKTATVEFELYALKKKIPLTPGFQPAVAEREYGTGNLLLGSAAVAYATYHRR